MGLRAEGRTNYIKLQVRICSTPSVQYSAVVGEEATREKHGFTVDQSERRILVLHASPAYHYHDQNLLSLLLLHRKKTHVDINRSLYAITCACEQMQLRGTE